MPDDEDEEDGSHHPGFAEDGDELDFIGRLERARAMSDADLLHAHRVLSNAKVLADSHWLNALEAEMERRGLRSLH